MSTEQNEARILDSISIVIPAYNEENNIELILVEALETVPKFSKKFEIIVVDDGSQDHTDEIVSKFSQIYQQIKLIKHPKNLGSGSAIWTGFLYSQHDYIFYTDADRQFRFKDLYKLVEIIDRYDIILGYRIKRKDSLTRIIYSKLWRLSIKILFDINIRDVNCAFKIFNKRVISLIKVKSKGAFVNAEIMIQLKELGYSWIEVGINHYPRTYGQPSGGKINVIFKAILEMLCFYLNRIFRNHHGEKPQGKAQDRCTY